MELSEAASNCAVVPGVVRLEPKTADDRWIFMELDRDLAPRLPKKASSGDLDLFPLSF